MRISPAKILAPLAAFAITLVVLTALNRNDPTSQASADRPVPASLDVRPGASTEEAIATMRRAVRAKPRDAALRVSLGDLLYQRGRETSDSAYNERAFAAYRAALRLDARSAGATAGLATLALAKHDFAAARRLGRRALSFEPSSVQPYGAIVDAEIELGRYADAGRSLQRMIELKPNLASYSRVSYWRELHGDLDGSLEALELAISAGGGTPENVAYVETLLGNLQFQRGDVDAAHAAYRAADDRVPGFLGAQVGLATVAAARGDLDGAIDGYRRAIAASPVHEYNVLLLEAQLAAGRTGAARRTAAEIRKYQAIERRNGVDTDAELAIFEAEQGSPARAVELGRSAVAAAPSVASADAYSWALTSAGRGDAALTWARRALRLGSQDPLLLYHAGMAAKTAGEPALARHWLTRALARNPRFSPLHARKARSALRSIASSQERAPAVRARPSQRTRPHAARAPASPVASVVASGSGS